MDINLPVQSYYPPDGSYFVDPMYVPYQKTPIKTTDGTCDVNTWVKQGPPEFVNPGLVRKGWCLDFQLLLPQDPCPMGWTKEEFGRCVAAEPEVDVNHGLYSKDAFIPEYQYFNGYTTPANNCYRREINEFDQRSVNPFTGKYVVYHNSKPSKFQTKYGRLPSRDSFIA